MSAQTRISDPKREKGQHNLSVITNHHLIFSKGNAITLKPMGNGS